MYREKEREKGVFFVLSATNSHLDGLTREALRRSDSLLTIRVSDGEKPALAKAGFYVVGEKPPGTVRNGP